MLPWESKYVFLIKYQTPKDVRPWAFPYIIIKTYSEKGFSSSFLLSSSFFSSSMGLA